MKENNVDSGYKYQNCIDGVHMAGETLVHEGDLEKLNEDTFYCNTDSGIAIVADGVTRPRTKDDLYPKTEGIIAPYVFRKAIASVLDTSTNNNNSRDAMLKAFRISNEAIQRENVNLGLDKPDFLFSDYLCTVGAVLNFRQGLVTVGYIGDCMVFHLPKKASPILLTKNQLQPWNRYYRNVPLGSFSDNANQKPYRNFWKRKYIRNVRRAKGPDDIEFEGFGVLTGEIDALSFVKVKSIKIQSGDRFLLASDALRACSINLDNLPDDIFDYDFILKKIFKLDALDSTKFILSQVRNHQRCRKLRDDITVVVVDVFE